MKFLEISNGILQPVNNEELIVLQRIRGSHNGLCEKKSLTLREKEIARQLCNRGIITRIQNQGNIYYRYRGV